MREILFRGKTAYTEIWLEGGFHSRDGKAYIIGISKSGRIDGCEVIPETVGQYTGLTDKNGKKIFEGDIISRKRSFTTIISVYFDEDYLQFRARKVNGFSRDIDYYGNYDEFEVIGNIHDNPELLKEMGCK